MESIEKVLETAVLLLKGNTVVFLAVFVFSIVANTATILAYFGSRRRYKTERSQREHLSKLVDTYEDVLQLSREVVQDKKKLQALKGEIEEKTERTIQLDHKAKAIQVEAQKSLVRQAIEYNGSVLTRAYAAIQDLRAQYKQLSPLPGVPADKADAIRNEVDIALKNPYEIPRDLQFKAVLLIFFLLLLPHPVDTLLMPFVLRFFLLVFYESSALLPWDYVRALLVRRYSLIVFLAAIGVWTAFYNVIERYARMFVFDSDSSDIVQVVLFVTGLNIFALAIVDWRRLRREIGEDVIPKLRPVEDQAGRGDAS